MYAEYVLGYILMRNLTRKYVDIFPTEILPTVQRRRVSTTSGIPCKTTTSSLGDFTRMTGRVIE